MCIRDSYDGGIKGSLEDIVRQLQRDLSQNERENNYITDDTARNLHAAVSELEHCGISTGTVSYTHLNGLSCPFRSICCF